MIEYYFSESSVRSLLIDLFSSDALFLSLLVLLTILFIALDALTSVARKKQEQLGILPQITRLFAKHENFIKTRTFVSEYQHLQATPDALMIEDGNYVPIERKVKTKKIRDRHKVELLVQMRLIEEHYGKKPPYGYLILGPNARKIKVLNTEQKQIWLGELIAEMLAIRAGDQKAEAEPQQNKCRKCWVEKICDYSVT